MKKQIFFQAAVLAALAAAAPSLAGDLTLPYPDFMPNTKAHADSVDANFAEVEVEVDDNAASITANAGSIAGNAAGIASNAADIAANAASISNNASDIGFLTNNYIKDIFAGVGLFGTGTPPSFTIGVANSGIGNAQLANGAVSTLKILDSNVTGQKILDGSVDTQDLANFSVTTLKIDDQAVTNVKLANDAVNGLKILDGAVGSPDLATGAISNPKIQNDAVLSYNIADEPGVANDVPPPTPMFPVAPIPDVLSMASIAPRVGGWVLVIATADVRIMRPGPVPNEIWLGVSDSPTAFPVNQDVRLYISPTYNDPVAMYPVTVHGIFGVVDALTDFFFLGQMDPSVNPVGGSYEVDNINLSVVYFSTAYGAVVSN